MAGLGVGGRGERFHLPVSSGACPALAALIGQSTRQIADRLAHGRDLLFVRQEALAVAKVRRQQEDPEEDKGQHRLRERDDTRRRPDHHKEQPNVSKDGDRRRENVHLSVVEGRVCVCVGDVT